MATESATPDNPSKTLDPAGKEAKADVAAAPTAAAVSDTEKKIRRAERFGITVQLSEEEKRSSRAERFGTVSSPLGSEGSKQSEELKRKARAERFGVPAPTAEEAKKKARLERFGSASKSDPAEEDKRKARAIRFSQAPVSSLSLDGKGNIEPKAAIAGKAGGGS